ncbi:iron chelate uptake ABC transporter family permease subunit [Pseudomonas sp. LRF_L74]|uniref:iron chelate uptake ABC transporter family permease subunit n=1 Tax=Pseudomonas sp. LRF_L74 TaxID=3369422 RepID=UPI003F5EED01
MHSLASHARHMSPGTRLLLLGLLALSSIALFMTLGVQGQWSFALPLRAGKIATLLLVSHAIAVSTVLFQTATNNRILTPAIMGFDALYLLIQTSIVYALGSKATLALPQPLLFSGQVALMILFCGLLHQRLLTRGKTDLHQLVLIGVILGEFFRSLSAFLLRLINPNEFNFLQDRFFSSFNNPDYGLLGISTLAVIAASAFGMRQVSRLDVMSLGKETATSLGLDHRRQVSRILVTVAVLVSVSTALVGPVTFFGLLVANLAYAVMATYRHALLLPAAVFIAITCLVGGQALLEHAFGFDTNLRAIVEFLGGITFIYLMLKGIRP